MATGTIKNQGWKLLWTNPNPTSTFAAQTLSLDLTGYSEVMVRYAVAQNTENNDLLTAEGFIPGQIEFTRWISVNTTNTAMRLTRRIGVASISGIAFEDNIGKQIGSAGVVDNTSNVPRYIYAR